VITFDEHAISVRIADNGHAIQATNQTHATMTADGATYELLQFHIHVPSEHTIDGKHFDAEMHLVHKDAAGKLAVVGILLQKGSTNRELAPFFDHLDGTAEHPSVQTLDVAPLLARHAGYFAYPGSLTTPPCSEGVSWRVFSDADTLSEDQLAKLVAASHHATNRPPQPAGARVLKKFGG
jgi:carbonic anhydrase